MTREQVKSLGVHLWMVVLVGVVSISAAKAFDAGDWVWFGFGVALLPVMLFWFAVDSLRRCPGE